MSMLRFHGPEGQEDMPYLLTPGPLTTSRTVKLAQLADWADHNTHSSIWSCLAAHAAVLWMDAIRRRRLDGKLFGVFKVSNTNEHILSAGLPASATTPYGRTAARSHGRHLRNTAAPRSHARRT